MKIIENKETEDLWSRLSDIEVLAWTNVLIIIFTDHTEFEQVPRCVDLFKDCCESDWTHKILVQISSSQNAEGIVRNSAVKRLITAASFQ